MLKEKNIKKKTNKHTHTQINKINHMRINLLHIKLSSSLLLLVILSIQTLNK
jgi:hypothetical protein